MKFQDMYMVAKKKGVPLLMVETPDAAAATVLITKAITGANREYPIIRWDMVRGVFPVNKQAENVVSNICGDPAELARPDELIAKLPKLPENCIVLMFGGEKIITEVYVRQGIWNMRDTFKANGRMLVLMVPIGTKLPTDIRDDVVVIDHQLPDEDGLQKVAASIVEDAKLPVLDEATMSKVVDATLGLSEFAAEQVIAMSLTKSGVDQDALWERKRKAIEQTAGLSVWKGKERFADIGGLDNAKKFFSAVVKGKAHPRVVVYIDEIEKAIGTQQDTSGTSQSMLGTLLTWMEDKDVTGTLLIGVAGSGKSAISKAIGNEANCPTVQFDLTGMKGGIVGSSEANLRAAIATVDAIGQGKIMVIATCNSMANMPPELKRRFKFSTMFFDLPTDVERAGIWKLYLKKFGLSGVLPNDQNWTGAEIRTCCQIADRLSISLVEAAAYIVPIAKSGAAVIDKLRREANGNYVSASYAGPYTYGGEAIAATTGRKIEAE
jgi:hypothetical protein